MTPRSAAAALAWSLAYLVTRGVVFAADALDLHRFDELYAGAAGLEVAAGRGLPLALVAHAPYSGGSILVALAASVLFPSLGASVLVLRLPSIVLGLVSFLAWRAILSRLCGEAAGRFAALCFVLAPPEFIRLGVLAWGNHAESAAPSAIGLLAFTALLGREGGFAAPAEPGRSSRRFTLAALAAAAAAFAVFFSYAALVPLLAMAAILAWLGRSGLDRASVAGFLAGLGTGALPAVWLALARRAEGPSFLVSLLFFRPRAAAAKLTDLLLVQLRSYLAPELSLGRAGESLFWAATLIALAAQAWRLLARLRSGRTVAPAESASVLPCLAFLVVYAFSGFPVGPRADGILAFRYLAPLTPFLLAALAASLARLPRRLALPCVVLLLVPNLAALVSRLPEVDRIATRLRGSSYLAYGGHVFEVSGFDREWTLAFLDRIADGDDRRAAEFAVATVSAGLMWRPPAGPARLDRLAPYLEALPGPGTRRVLFAHRLGLVLEGPGGLTLDRAGLAAVGRVLSPEPSAVALPLGRAAILALGGEAAPADVVALPAAARAGGYEALGALAARSWLGRRAVAAPPLESPARRSYWRGFGYGLGRAALDHAAPLQSAVGVDADWDAAGAGVEEALRVVEPEDPVRRAALARRAGLADLRLPLTATDRVDVRP